jgi:hypothetical protein
MKPLATALLILLAGCAYRQSPPPPAAPAPPRVWTSPDYGPPPPSTKPADDIVVCLLPDGRRLNMVRNNCIQNRGRDEGPYVPTIAPTRDAQSNPQTVQCRFPNGQTGNLPLDDCLRFGGSEMPLYNKPAGAAAPPPRASTPPAPTTQSPIPLGPPR